MLDELRCWLETQGNCFKVDSLTSHFPPHTPTRDETLAVHEGEDSLSPPFFAGVSGTAVPLPSIWWGESAKGNVDQGGNGNEAEQRGRRTTSASVPTSSTRAARRDSSFSVRSEEKGANPPQGNSPGEGGTSPAPQA